MHFSAFHFSSFQLLYSLTCPLTLNEPLNFSLHGHTTGALRDQNVRLFRLRLYTRLRLRRILINITTVFIAFTQRLHVCGVIVFRPFTIRRSEWTRVLYLRKQVSIRPIRLQQAFNTTWFTVEGQVVELRVDVI